jgi:hypothetical protein
MRLSEFTDPAIYTPTSTALANVLKQIERIWPNGTTDDGTPHLLRPRKKCQTENEDSLDEL